MTAFDLIHIYNDIVCFFGCYYVIKLTYINNINFLYTNRILRRDGNRGGWVGRCVRSRVNDIRIPKAKKVSKNHISTLKWPRRCMYVCVCAKITVFFNRNVRRIHLVNPFRLGLVLDPRGVIRVRKTFFNFRHKKIVIKNYFQFNARWLRNKCTGFRVKYTRKFI